MARAMRMDLSTNTPLGAQLLNEIPNEETSISGQTFAWSAGIMLGHAYATGEDLITKYEKINGAGFVLDDGVIETASAQSLDPSRMTTAGSLGTTIVTSDGTSNGAGTIFLDVSFRLGDGMMLSDGMMIGDGIMVSDGIMVGDPTPGLAGDDTGCMR